MNDEVIRLTAADFEEAMDFLNMVFSMSGRPHHFQSLLPKLYQPDDEKMSANFAIRRKGKIRALVGLYPMLLHIGSSVLKVGGIGAVSTHPDERKSGLMRRLMTAVLDEMEQQGYALSVLGGQRQRYGYYGYEQSGTRLTFTLTKTNLKHFFRDHAYTSIRFQLIDPEDNKTGDMIVQMKRWHDSQPIYVERPLESFLTILSSWYAKVWLACNEGGEPIGYLVSNPEGTYISELQAAKPDLLLAIAAAWVNHQTENSVNFSLAPWQQDAIADLSRLAEHCEIQPDYSFRINDWPLVLTSLLDAKAKLKPIPDGRFCLGIEDQGQVNVFELLFLGGKASCCPCARNEADFVLDRLTATRLFLGPLPPSWVIPKYLDCAALHQLLSLWFPLPICWPSPDSV